MGTESSLDECPGCGTETGYSHADGCNGLPLEPEPESEPEYPTCGNCDSKQWVEFDGVSIARWCPDCGSITCENGDVMKPSGRPSGPLHISSFVDVQIKYKCHNCEHVTDNPEISKSVGDFFRCIGCMQWTEILKPDPCQSVKHDEGKPPMGLLPGAALERVAKVLGHGAEKYSPNNWRGVKPGSRYLDAALRHLHAYAGGEDNDPESGLPHTDHAACCVLFMIELGDCRHKESTSK